MYKQRVNYVIIGMFVSTMIVAGVASVALLDGRTGPMERYFVVLDNVADVKFGTQVRYEGYPIGQVEGITPIIDGPGMKFRIDVSIRQGWQIPTDSIARATSSNFLAAKTLDIESGQSPATVKVGQQIAAEPATDVFATITQTASEFTKLSRERITPLLATLQSLGETIQGDAPRITRELVAFTEELNETLKPIQQILSDKNLRAVNNIVGNVEETAETMNGLGRDLSGTMAKIDNLTLSLDRLIESNMDDVDQALKDVRYTLSAISSTVDSVVHNLDGTARNMNEFSRLIRRNPGLLLDGTPREAVSPVRARTTQQGNRG
jgi:phospholipid/cholesterol/gamma-HCH transport system substrate-binding protein